MPARGHMTDTGNFMQVRLLGPIDILIHGEPRPVHGLRRQAVLAVLALHCGEVVSTDHLMEAVWGGTAPVTASNSMQSHVSYLRGLMGTKTAILTRSPGYLLNLPGDGTDVRLAERLLRESANSAEAISRLQTALALWRGEPMGELAELPWRPAQSERLNVLRMQLRQALSQARLAAGEHSALVPELEQMVTDCPLDERLHGQLMLALYRSGRQADALAAYHRLRQALDDDLGIEPSQFLRDLQTAILNQDPALNAAPPVAWPGPAAPNAAAPTTTAPALPGLAQLPSALPGFTGRTAELACLDATMATMALAAISGTAGVGKTALAVHWAHRVAAQFPDGQLYVNLRGFDPAGAGAALEPSLALHGFLDALGVPANRVPEDLAAQSALFRSLVADKRILLMLDNARSADQVRPLLPGSPGCLTLVTSRDQLAGLVAADGAVPLALDLLSTADARDLLTRRLGELRVAAEPAPVDSIITACARLPLALAIVAARAAAHPSFPLAAIAAELAEATSALDPFDGGDLTTDVRAVFSWSYRALGDPAARMFRLLGLHPGPDIAVAAAASLAAVPLGQARAQLTELTRAHLLTEHAPGRYAFHDLLRAYAGELTRVHDDQACSANSGRPGTGPLPAHRGPRGEADGAIPLPDHHRPAPGGSNGRQADDRRGGNDLVRDRAADAHSRRPALGPHRSEYPLVAARLDAEHLLAASRPMARPGQGVPGRAERRPPGRRSGRRGPVPPAPGHRLRQVRPSRTEQASARRRPAAA